MRSSHLVRVVLPVVLLAACLGVGSAAADDVSDQQRRVEQIADQLDALENRIGQLGEDHAAALDRLDELAIEITRAQASVDAKNAELATVQGQLTAIAVDAFVGAGAVEASPLFSSIDDFTDGLARTELARVALDQGAGTSDEMQALIADLATEQAALQAKQAEQTSLVADIEARQAEGDQLTVQYEQDYAAAKAELGDLIRQEQERRLAAAVAAAQRAAENNRPVTPPARGGGATPPADGGGNTGDTGGGDDNGGGGDGGSTPAPAPAPTPPPPSAPPPASTAGIAVGAAQSQLGVSYKFATANPGVAFDCSGLTKWAWGRAGVYLPHQSAQQYASTPHVSKDEAQPGDLVFYHSPIGHVGIYIGGGQMIHATAPGDVVKVSPVRWNKVVGVSRPG